MGFDLSDCTHGLAFWDVRRPSQRRCRSGFAPDSLFSSDRNQRHLLVFLGFRPKLFKEPKIVFSNHPTMLAASHAVTRLSEKSPAFFVGTDRLCPGRTRLECSEQSKKRNFERMETPRRIITRTAWRLAKNYWTSEEKRSAWALLVAVGFVNLGNGYIGVRINLLNRAFYNALQMVDAMELLRQVGNFVILVTFPVLISVSALYLCQLLQIRC